MGTQNPLETWMYRFGYEFAIQMADHTDSHDFLQKLMDRNGDKISNWKAEGRSPDDAARLLVEELLG